MTLGRVCRNATTRASPPTTIPDTDARQRTEPSATSMAHSSSRAPAKIETQWGRSPRHNHRNQCLRNQEVNAIV
jgi:hypothetical protein